MRTGLMLIYLISLKILNIIFFYFLVNVSLENLWEMCVNDFYNIDYHIYISLNSKILFSNKVQI